MKENKVYNSIDELIRVEPALDYDWGFTESIYILNIMKEIRPKYISKELGILIRNLNKKEIEYYYKIIKSQFLELLDFDYDIMCKIENIYDGSLPEIYNTYNFQEKLGNIKECYSLKTIMYLYARQIYKNNSISKKYFPTAIEELENKDSYAEKIALDISSKIIVVEIKDYSKIYKILDHYYGLNTDSFKMNVFSKSFIKDFIKFCNVVFLESDSTDSEENNIFRIEPIEEYDLNLYKLATFNDGYYHQFYKDKIITKNLNKINSNIIDNYIKNNKENLNNFLFILSKLDIKEYEGYDQYYIEYNYKDYNLALVSILELLLVNSKTTEKIAEKFIKNILICLSINNNLDDEITEKKIIKEIYSYRSSILHGNLPGYKNSICNLGKLLSYVPEDLEKDKTTTIEKLISKRLNKYVKAVFEVNALNQQIIRLLKS